MNTFDSKSEAEALVRDFDGDTSEDADRGPDGLSSVFGDAAVVLDEDTLPDAVEVVEQAAPEPLSSSSSSSSSMNVQTTTIPVAAATGERAAAATAAAGSGSSSAGAV